MPFLLIFIVIPFIELIVFVAVSEHIGFLTAVFLAFLTAIIGSILVKYQGLHTLQAFNQSIRDRKVPLNEIFDGLCLVAAGVLLITPGFVADMLGFLLLVPTVRAKIRDFIKSRAVFHTYAQSGDIIIEGEYETMDDEDEPQTYKSLHSADKERLD